MSLFIYGAVMKPVLGAEELRKKGIEIFLKGEGKSIYRASNKICFEIQGGWGGELIYS